MKERAADKGPSACMNSSARSAERNRMHEPEMPYERFLEKGAGSLTNAELLAIILRTGTGGRSAVDLARQILDRGGGRLSALHDLDLKDLLEIRGIGTVKAVKVLSLAELSLRLSREKAERTLVFHSPASVAEYYMEKLRHEPREVLCLLLLDNRMALIREEILSRGTVNATLISPRDIYIRALKGGAVNIMLLHNHPSGDPSPSRADLLVTDQVRKAGELLDIRLRDHIIIGDLTYYSMKEEGRLDR